MKYTITIIIYWDNIDSNEQSASTGQSSNRALD